MTFKLEYADTTAVALRTQVQELTDRIARQEMRIRQIKATGIGPCDDMEVVLADMMERRTATQARLANIEAAPAGARPVVHPEPRFRLVPRADIPPTGNGSNDQDWSIKLFRGGVRLRRLRSSRS